MRILVVLQYYEGDAGEAKELLKFIAKHSKGHDINDFDLLLAERRGMPKGKMDDIKADLGKVFKNIYQFTGTRREVGWPAGCNALWHETIWWAQAHRMRGESLADWQGMFTIESDCCPLTKPWLKRIQARYSCCLANGKAVLGHLLPEHDHPHVNGNAVFPVDIAARYGALYGCDPVIGWDAAHASKWLKDTQDDICIRSLWQTKTISEQQVRELIKKHTHMLHGVKDSSARDIMEKLWDDTQS